MFKMEMQLSEAIRLTPNRTDQLNLIKASMLNPAKYHCPTGKQEEFIKLVAKSTEKTDSPVVLLCGGNRSGKTQEIAHTFTNIVFGVQNGWYDYEFFRNWKYGKIAWVVSAKTVKSQTILPLIRELFPTGYYEEFKDKQEDTARIVVYWDTAHTSVRWTIYFYTFDQDIKQFAGVSVALEWIDEPMPQTISTEVLARTSEGGITLWGMTPLKLEPYILEEFSKSQNSHRMFMMEMSLYDSCMERGIRGFRTRKMTDDQILKYPPEEFDARVYGKFMYFQEKIIASFDYNTHVVEDAEYPIDAKRDLIVMAVDPHNARPSSAIWLAFQECGRIVCFACYPSYDGVTPFWKMKLQDSFADEVKKWAEIEDRFGIKKLWRRKMDKRYGFSESGEQSLAQKYAEEGRKIGRNFIFSKAYDVKGGELTYRHNILRSMFSEVLDDGKPKCVIYKSCFHVWNGFMHYVFEQQKTNADHKKAVGETRILEYPKDFPDTFGYGSIIKVPLKAFADWCEDIKESGNSQNAEHTEYTKQHNRKPIKPKKYDPMKNFM